MQGALREAVDNDFMSYDEALCFTPRGKLTPIRVGTIVRIKQI